MIRTSLFAAALLLAAPATAHDMWVNAPFAVDPESGRVSVVTSIGWGHAPMPTPGFVAGERLSHYDVVGPDGTRFALPLDPAANAEVAVPPVEGARGLALLQAGDTFARRMRFEDGAAEGAWRVQAGQRPRVWTTWTDAAGARISGARFADELAAGATVISSAVGVRGADAYWTVGAWSPPQPTGAPVELLPAAAPEETQPGETLAFALHGYGTPVTGRDSVTVTAFDATGEVEGRYDPGTGRVEVALPRPGQWIVRASYPVPVAEAGDDFAAFAGRVETIRFTGTVSVIVAAGSHEG